MEKNKKAQITVFIIIGLVLLVSASIVIYLNTLKKVDVIEEVIVPPEVQPIYDYVTNCLMETGEDAIQLIGMQGGYVDLSPERVDTRDIVLTPSAYIKLDPNNMFKVPHWFYDGEDRIPPIEFLESEIREYVYDNLVSCLGNFTPFLPQYEIIPEQTPAVTTVLTDDDVVIRLEFPLDIRQGDKATKHSEFITHIPVKLKKIWALAAAIMRKENELNFFDDLTIDLMAINKDIPMDGLQLKCGVDVWSLDQIKKDTQRMLRFMLPLVRVKGTDVPEFMAPDSVYEELKEYTMKEINEENLPDIPTPDDAFEYNRMMLDPEVSGVEDLKVTFIYQERFGLDLNALPNDGGMLRSNMAPGQSFLAFMCINNFHFAYDVIYPIQTRIVDPDAYDGLGYVFQFGFPVLIDDNKARREEFGVRLFEDFYSDVSFCEQFGGEPVEIRAIGVDDEGFDADYGLQDVNMTIHCASKRCLLGATGYDQNAPGRYSLLTSLPPGCKNPMVYAEKTGYLKGTGQLTSDTLEIDMIKLKKFPITVVRHDYREGAGFGTGLQEEAELMNGDKVSIYVKLRDPPLSHDQYVVFDTGINRTQYIELVDGEARYDFDVMLMNFDKFVGGYRAKNLTISYDEFSGYGEMVLHVFDYKPRPLTGDQMFHMITYFTGSTYKEELRPTFR